MEINMGAFLEHLKEEHNPPRSRDSIKAAIIHECACKVTISGRHDFNMAMQKILKETIQNKEFESLLNVLSEMILFMFPNPEKKREEAEESHLN